MRTNIIIYIIVCCCLSIFSTHFVFAQKYKAQKAEIQFYPELSKNFAKYEIFEIDLTPLNEQRKSNIEALDFVLELGDEYQWPLRLQLNDLRSSDYLAFAHTKTGKRAITPTSPTTYKGYLDLNNGGNVRLNIEDSKITGFITVDGEQYFIEPLSNTVKNIAQKNTSDTNELRELLMVYKAQDYISQEPIGCGVDKVQETYNKHKSETTFKSSTTNPCRVLQIATVADYGLYQNNSYSSNATNNTIANWLNLTEPLFEDEFNITFEITEQQVFSCSACNPWGSEQIEDDTLSMLFRTWAYDNSFDNHFDLPQLYTYDGMKPFYARGYATSIVCSYKPLNIIETHYSAGIGVIGVLIAHEMGHTFGAYHISGCNIMQSSVSSTCNNWDPSSITRIHDGMSGNISAIETCLAPCDNFCFPDYVLDRIDYNSYFTDRVASDETMHYEAQNTIQTAEIVTYNDTRVTYDAGNSITLLTGFEAGNGGFVEAVIDGCGGSYKTADDRYYWFTDLYEDEILDNTVQKTDNDILQTTLTVYSDSYTNTSKFKYQLAKDTEASLMIFDITGKIVARPLEQESKMAGTYYLDFDTSQLPNGMYVCTLQTSEETLTQKIALQH